MSDTGWVNPGTGSEVVLSGSVVDWSNESNILAPNSNYASSGSWGDYSSYLFASNFGFEIPNGADIDGIEVTVKGYTTQNQTYDYSLRLSIAGNPSGDNNASATYYALSNNTREYGSSVDLWGLTPTTLQVNNTNFGVMLSITDSLGPENIYIDNIQIKVYYTEGGTPTVGAGYPLPPFKNS